MGVKIQISKNLYKFLLGVWSDRLNPNAIVISYLAAKNFTVIRFPTRPDRSVDGGAAQFKKAVDDFDELSDEELQNLADELKSVTGQTQQYLSTQHSSGKIKLERSIAPLPNNCCQYTTANRNCDGVELTLKLVLAAKKAGLESIDLDFDILSGWSTRATCRYGTIQIAREWAINDIFLVSDYLCGESGGVGPLESDEWLCVNRGEKGLLKIKLSDVSLKCVPQTYIEFIENQSDVKKYAIQLQEQITNKVKNRRVAPRDCSNQLIVSKRLPPESFFSKLRYLFKS